jgi:hypothetical protein
MKQASATERLAKADRFRGGAAKEIIDYQLQIVG